MITKINPFVKRAETSSGKLEKFAERRKADEIRGNSVGKGLLGWRGELER